MKKLIIVTCMAMLALASCKKDQNEVKDPVPPNEAELITTLTLHLHEKGNMNNHVEASFKDLDGAGGNDATIDEIVLDSNTTYEVSLEVKDESGADVVDITSEIQEEAGEHIFCFDPTTNNVTVTITDTDGTHPLGLTSEWTTGSAETGTIKITLKHQTDGSKDGTCSPGETDIEVDFNLTIN